MPWIHLHDHSLDGCIHTIIHVSFLWVSSDVYVYVLACRFFNGRLRFPALIYKAFHPSLQLGLHALGGICYTTFCHYPCTPCSLILETSTMNPACFSFMKKLPLCPSSWENQFPFAPFPLKLLFFPVYKTGANGPYLPHADVQILALSLVPTGATELCSSRVGPIMESFLN